MSLKSVNFNMRMEEQKKQDAEALYRALGMSLPQAVNMFISQSLLVGGLPFEVRLPRYSAATEAAMREARDIASGKQPAKAYHSAEELFEELDAE
jgi:DNA-damage-inducible protein J